MTAPTWMTEDERNAWACGEPDGKSCTVPSCPWCGANPECGCGHPAHGDEPCTGTLATVSDGDLVAVMVRNGADPNEPCACVEYVPQ